MQKSIEARRRIRKLRKVRSLILCVVVLLLLNPSLNLVKSLGKKDVPLTYSQDVKNISSDIMEQSINETVDDNMTAEKTIINVPIINQLPDLYNGCEITSLAMLLKYNNINVTKNILAKEVKRDPAPLIRDSKGTIKSWGDPEYGFVGDVEGDNGIGYAIYPKALLPLANKYLNNNAVDLTGETTDTLIKYLSQKNPILVWVTTDFSVPADFVTWTKNNKTIKATFNEHCVLLTGYDDKYFYYNDPLTGKKNEAIDKETFEKVWNAMGNLALSYN